MQLVGQICVHCRARITREGEARFCARCQSAAHNVCAKRAVSTAAAGGCRACGAAKPAGAPTSARNKPPRGPTVDRGYYTILLGVALMIAAILGATCLGIAFGDGQFAVTGTTLFVGVVLASVGFLRNTRR